jgi:hypothetical protein
MKQTVQTDKKPLTLVVYLKSTTMEKVRLIVYDETRKNTVYFNSSFNMNKPTKIIHVKMPISPNVATIQLDGLGSKFTAGLFRNESLQSFIEFYSEFCDKAGYLASGKTYLSDDKKFRIEYVEDAEGLNCLRINEGTGIIQVRASRFRGWTIPMRFAVGTHEYFHFYGTPNKHEINKDELDVDSKSAYVCLGLGFPKFELMKAWIDVYDKAPTGSDKLPPEHEERIKNYERIIDSFENAF